MERVEKPWGYYEILCARYRYQVKRIAVLPGAKLSLQSHLHREERWTVVRGSAQVTVGTEVLFLPEVGTIFIGRNQRHRLENCGRIELEVIEVQYGDYLGEDDIVRYDDVYGRVPAAPSAPAL
jgi:mannose-1-phosphate guanylyltransferase / mannose-6-phosphate isomerase